MSIRALAEDLLWDYRQSVMSGLSAIRELRVCGEATAEFLSRPLTVDSDDVPASVLPRVLVWLQPWEAAVAAAVSTSWRRVAGASPLAP